MGATGTSSIAATASARNNRSPQEIQPPLARSRASSCERACASAYVAQRASSIRPATVAATTQTVPIGCGSGAAGGGGGGAGRGGGRGARGPGGGGRGRAPR